ncbi:MAG: MarP family serine protease [Actinomycetota bacterium]|nr:MarP family serine protease [Actinomycetota bacterium]
MTVLDLVIVLLAVSAAAVGHRMGLLARLISWAGMGLGLLVASRVTPDVVEWFPVGSALDRLLVGALVVIFTVGVGASLGGAVGLRLRLAVPPGAATGLDKAGGAVAGVFSLLVAVWFLLPAMAEVPGVVARHARSSAIGGFLEDMAPEPPASIQALRELVTQTRFPQVFDALRPAPDLGPPPAELPLAAATLADVRDSTVNVESFGCGRRHEGSGFTVATNTVVTNAHVVAGSERLRVRRPDGRLLPARVTAFDDNRDLAVLAVPGLGQDPLPIGPVAPGAAAAVVGYPGGQNVPRAVPATVEREQTVVGRDIYGDERTRRRVLFLAARLRPGDSGAPVVGGTGRVVGVTFAVAPDRPTTAYAVTDDELRAVLAAPRAKGPGPCIN